MFWWFEREGAFLRCEILTLLDGDYELRVVDEAGSEMVEHFSDTDSLNTRQKKILGDLADKGWTGPHGWVL
jgi:hypothetical protein